jgi:dihydropteroate synthase
MIYFSDVAWTKGAMSMGAALGATHWDRYSLAWGTRTYVMGILNITPDSFSGDGLMADGAMSESVVQVAVRQAEAMVAGGADILDIGGESTRPSTTDQPPLDEAVERQRVVPVVEALRDALPSSVILSIDTYKASVAAAALRAGAAMVNDVWGLRRDPDMAHVVAERGVPVVLMSNLRGQARRDPLGDVARQLAGSLDLALTAGIDWSQLIVDPGFGFGLTAEENLAVLRRLGALRTFGRPLLVGTSRKSMIGKVLGGLPEDQRVEGTAATVALAIAQGADIVRVHDVREMVRVARMADAVVRGWTP